jgi:hypothetical protein
MIQMTKIFIGNEICIVSRKRFLNSIGHTQHKIEFGTELI